MPISQNHRSVDVHCPKCAERPVVKVYENRSMAVLFCESCEHAWTVLPADIPSGFSTMPLPRAING